MDLSIFIKVLQSKFPLTLKNIYQSISFLIGTGTRIFLFWTLNVLKKRVEQITYSWTIRGNNFSKKLSLLSLSMFTIFFFKLTYLHSILLKRPKIINLIQTLCKKCLQYAKNELMHKDKTVISKTFPFSKRKTKKLKTLSWS